MGSEDVVIPSVENRVIGKPRFVVTKDAISPIPHFSRQETLRGAFDWADDHGCETCAWERNAHNESKCFVSVHLWNVFNVLTNIIAWNDTPNFLVARLSAKSNVGNIEHIDRVDAVHRFPEVDHKTSQAIGL